MWDGLPNSPHCSYIIEEGICYLALCEEAYPSQLAFSYLNNLHTEFIQQHGHEVYKAQRPYFFIEFGKHDIVDGLQVQGIEPQLSGSPDVELALVSEGYSSTSWCSVLAVGFS